MRRLSFSPIVASALLAALLPAALAQDRPNLTSEQLTYEDKTKEMIYAGGAKLMLGDSVLLADEMRWNTATGLITATGHFSLTTGARRLLADRGAYQVRTKELSVTNLRLGEFPVYISGDTLAGTEDDLTFTNATVFFREADACSPTLRARKLIYRRGRLLLGEDVSLGLFGFNLPSLHFRHFAHDLHTSLLSYLRTKVGYRGNLGAYTELGLHLPVTPELKLGGDLALYSSRGLMFGPSGSYGASSPDNTFAGFFRSGYLNDHGDKKTDVLGRPVPEQRAYLEWRHQQQMGDRLAFSGQFNYWRDSEVLRDFHNQDFASVQQPDSFLEGAYAGGNYVLGAFTRFHPNRFQRVQERLPEVRFDLLPSALGGGFYHRLNASYAALQEDAFGAAPAQHTDRLDVYYALERPIAPTPWFTFTPVAGGRLTYYADPLNRSDAYTRSIGEIGFDARLLASGAFDCKNEVWNINGLRHLVEPRLSYRYAPGADRGRRYIPPIDRQVFSTYLQPLSIGDQRNLDDLSRLNALRVSLGNILQTREAAYGSRDLASLDFAADYQFDPPPGGRRWSAVHARFTLTPAPWLRLETYHRVTPQDFTLREWNTGLELIDQEWWSLRLSTHYLQHQFEEYFIDCRRRLNETYDVVALLRFDARHHRVTEQTYGLWQKLGRTWAIKYEVSLSAGPRREGHFGFNVEVDLLKF